MNSLYYKKYTYLLVFFLLGLILNSCLSDDDISPNENLSKEYLRIKMTLPSMKSPSSRAMSHEKENTLDLENLNVMIVKGDVVSKASLVGSVVYDEADHSKATITVRLPKSTDDTDKIKLCLVANHVLPDPYPTSYEVFKNITFDVPDKWDTAESIPMWGESEEIVVNDAMATHTIDMHRALARIDVGLNFISLNGSLTEEVNGLANFKINSVSVHCTYNMGYVIPIAGLDSPNIPSGATQRLPDNPLIYGSLGGIDSYVREIYVPESQVPDPFDKENMHCVVVGGFYDGSPTETFYRLDFVIKDTDEPSINIPILRNRRYVLNIKKIDGPGYSSREDAFLSEAITIDYDVIVLDETINHVELDDGHYFGLDDRNLIFEPQSGISTTVKYQTDLPVSETVTLEWSNPTTGSARYSVLLDTGTKSFTIQTLTKNISGLVYTDTLYVKSGSFVIPIRVQQKCANLSYSIDCESVAVSGTYVIGEALDINHYISLSITAADHLLDGETYIIETQDLDGNHGISFSTQGIFNFSSIPAGDPLVTNVQLAGSGTLLSAAGSVPFKLRITTNSGSTAFCEATIVPVDTTINIVVMSPNTDPHGYAIDRFVGGAGKVFNHPNNFGPYDYSIVKTAGFSYINDNADYDFSASPTSNIYKWVTGIGNNGKLADLVYIGNGAVFGEATAQLLDEYLSKGGVIVAFQEDATSVQSLMGEVFSPSTISAVVLKGSEGGGAIYPMPVDSALVTDEEQRQTLRIKFEGDPILNGPFGDIRDKQLGEDVGNAVSLLNVPTTGQYESTVTVYAYFNNVNTSPMESYPNNVLGFKLEEDDGRNIFFWGDGGATASAYDGSLNGYPDLTGYTQNPFSWDTDTYFPIAMPSYGLNAEYRKPVYNSTLFCNAMAWAIKKSQSLKAKRVSNENPTP